MRSADDNGTRRAPRIGLLPIVALALAIFALPTASVAQQGARRLQSAAAAATPMVCTNGPTFDLKATKGSISTPDGGSVFMWGYAKEAGSFQMPGPVLCVNEGETVTVNLTNELPEAVSIVFPGQGDVGTTGGSPGFFTAEAPSGGGSVSYSFVAGEPGTYLYESGTRPHKQVQMGLYGALVVRPTGHPDWAYDDASTEFDREYLLLLHAIDPTLHAAVQKGKAFNITTLVPRYWTVNGRAFPDTIAANSSSQLPTQPYSALVQVEAGAAKPALIRFANASMFNHPFHPHGDHLKVIAHDGRLLRSGGEDISTEAFTKTIGSGQTFDLLFGWTDVDAWSPSGNPVPVTIPGLQNLAFKDGVTFYSGSPYLGETGELPTGVTSYNECGEFYFPWHSHALHEFTNFNEGFGGLATLLRVDPPGGCAAAPPPPPPPPGGTEGYPTSTEITKGTNVAGNAASLGADDADYFQVNAKNDSTKTAEWLGVIPNVPNEITDLRVTYKGKNSIPCLQKLAIRNFDAGSWVILDQQTVGDSDVLIADKTTSLGALNEYVKGTSGPGEVRVRIRCTTKDAQFVSSGNLMKIVYTTP